MKITEVKTLTVDRFVFVKINTDEGFSGLGEITLDGRLTTVVKAMDHLAPLLIGRSPLDTEHIWQDIYRGTFWRGGPVLLTALSGVDIALWDIKGKAFNVPVYDLIGGKARKKILVYGHAGGKTKEELAENSLKRIEQGYRVIRICPSDVDVIDGIFEPGPAIRRSVKFFSHLRKVVGEDIGIIYEVHTRLSPANAIELCNAIAEFRPMFVEDPIRSESPEAFALLRAHTDVHLATGEQLGAKWDFRTLIEKDLIDYIRADVCHCGGITETLKIAAMAETHYQEMALHHAMSPVCGFASLHVDYAIPNFLVQEFNVPDKRDKRFSYLDYDLTLKDGYLTIPDRPGLGIDIDETAGNKSLRIAELPHWRREDGSVQEW